MVLQGMASKPGFDLVCKNDSFKCAFITRSAQYAPGQIKTMKRHNTSDEVFVLVRGNALLVTGEPTKEQYHRTVLESGVSYCVEAGTWHYLAVSEDALIFVAENSQVSAVNTDEICIEEHNVIAEV